MEKINSLTPGYTSVNNVSNTKKSNKKEKIVAAAASAVVPGAGQLMNGDYKKAIKHYFISIPVFAGNDALGSTFDKLWRTYSAYDAYKNTKVKEQNQEYKVAG